MYNRQALFNLMDKDNNGLLTTTEYSGSNSLFNDMDLDSDGDLTYAESKNMITFAEIPTGSFVMGSDKPLKAFFKATDDCTPERKVFIDGFKMSSTEVTNAQYVSYLNAALKKGIIDVKLDTVSNAMTRIQYPVPAYAVYGAKGSEFAGKPYIFLSPVSPLSHTKMKNGLLRPEHPLNLSWITFHPTLNRFEASPGFEDWPASHVRWWGAVAFAKYYGLSLPTEAEWEYAAKGGKDLQYPTYDGLNDGQRSNHACYNVMGIPAAMFDGEDTPEAFIGFRYTVGSYKPNPYGLYDMAGNVWEWCLDWYSETFYQECIDKGITKNPLNTKGVDAPFLTYLAGVKQGLTGGPGQKFSHSARVCRGGSWNYHKPVTQTEYRFPVYSFISNDHFGFRVVLRAEGTKFNQ